MPFLVINLWSIHCWYLSWHIMPGTMHIILGHTFDSAAPTHIISAFYNSSRLLIHSILFLHCRSYVLMPYFIGTFNPRHRDKQRSTRQTFLFHRELAWAFTERRLCTDVEGLGQCAITCKQQDVFMQLELANILPGINEFDINNIDNTLNRNDAKSSYQVLSREKVLSCWPKCIWSVFVLLLIFAGGILITFGCAVPLTRTSTNLRLGSELFKKRRNSRNDKEVRSSSIPHTPTVH